MSSELNQKTKLPGGWVSVGLSQDFQIGELNIAVIDDTELVIWRDQNGDVHAWDNRCPHRGMRFSLGFVRGNHLACLYHGWQFRGDGQCVYTPAIPSLNPPKSISAHVFCCIEFMGLIWVANPDANPEDVSILKNDVHLSRDYVPIRSLIIQSSSKIITEGLNSIPFPPSTWLETRQKSYSEDVKACEARGTFIWEDAGTSIKASYHMSELNPGFIKLICKYEDHIDILLLALQKINIKKTAIQMIFVSDIESSVPNSLRLAYARWFKIFRHKMEKSF